MRKDVGKTVFVGLSGGVDSSVAAARLLERGYDVVGVFIKVWQPDFLRCNAEAERLDAMRVAARLRIPFLTLDAAAEYKKEVGDYFVSEYLAGRTPNPDVLCNRHVKFGAFWRFARERGADFIATGHYARIEGANDAPPPQASSAEGGGSPGDYRLLRGADPSKDQSYFLWMLTEGDLAHTLFPVGDAAKEAIRAEAAKYSLPTAAKKDSQGICFLGQVDVPEFLSHFTTLAAGDVRNPAGEVIGRHQGALLYTLGQRHNFTIFGEAGRQPHYVIGKDMEKNVIVADTAPPVVESGSRLMVDRVNVIGEEPLPEEIGVQFRYRQAPLRARAAAASGGRVALMLHDRADRPAAGQSAVFYRGDQCLGGGVIE